MTDTHWLIVPLSFLVIALSIQEWIHTTHNKTPFNSIIHFFAAQLCDDLILGSRVKLIYGADSFGVGSFGANFDTNGTNNVSAIVVDLEKERNLEFIHIFVRRTFSSQWPFTDDIIRFLHTVLI